MAKIVRARLYALPSNFDPAWRSGPILVGTVFYIAPGNFVWDSTRSDKSKAVRFFNEAEAEQAAKHVRRVVTPGLERGEYLVVDVIDD